MATIFQEPDDRQQTLLELQNEYALTIQRTTPGVLPDSVKSMLIDHFREHASKIAEHAIRAVEIPAPTAQDRKEAPSWCDVIDTKREEQSTRAERFLTAPRW